MDIEVFLKSIDLIPQQQILQRHYLYKLLKRSLETQILFIIYHLIRECSVQLDMSVGQKWNPAIH